MKKITTIIFVFSLMGFTSIWGQDSSKAANKKMQNHKGNHRKMNFVDKNGDGYNDNAPDHDGDGIPNGLDPDYMKLKKREAQMKMEYVDSDGDGINDNLQFGRNGRGAKKGHGKGNGLILKRDFGIGEMGTGNGHGRKGMKGKK